MLSLKPILIFDRDATVRAALRAYVEGIVAQLPNCLSFPAAEGAIWAGDLQRGALRNDDGCGDYEVIAWTEAGIVGLAFEIGAGAIEQLAPSPAPQNSRRPSSRRSFADRPTPETLLDAQRALQKVGISWPGSPEIPPEKLPPTSLPKP
jgi:hypothetical protein